jgi:Flp pilus assembly pilin Flp
MEFLSLRRGCYLASQEAASVSAWILKIVSLLQDLKTREEGQDLVENALVLALISVGAVALLTGIGAKVVNTLSSINSAL